MGVMAQDMTAGPQAAASRDLTINMDRLRKDILELAGIGRDEAEGGLYRMAFTPADMEGRRWLRDRIEEAGLEPVMDGAANLGTRYGGQPGEPIVMVGSHIDTVPNAGYLDGTLGVLIGLEAVRRFKEEGIETRLPLELISFSDEEGRFGGLFGSQAVAGELNPDLIRTARDLNGVSLVEAMAACGFDAMEALNARRDRDTIHSYLELHIEQGPVLDRERIPIGVVENITGLFKWSVRLEGVPNHAGTTPMDMRRDPFMGLAEFAGEIPRILEENGSELSRATIGKVDLFPGAANTVPGEVVFSMDVRDTSREVMDQLSDAFRKALSAIARRRKLQFHFDLLSDVEPAPCDPGLVETIEAEARKLGLPSLRMPSGAAHDAQIMSHIAPIGMVFVPSKDGRSHSPAEWTAWEDIEAGANVVLRSLLEISGGR
jgi:beta-ureidopropionase / N-carbamoyl-L-amino-acid hydrolase